MIDLKKLSEFQSAIEKVSLEICEHAQKDLKSNCGSISVKCPYQRLCTILTQAKGRAMIMQHNPNNPNK
jgi:hypothetical protein